MKVPACLALTLALSACETNVPGPVDAVPISSKLQAEGLSAPVDIVRDEAGIPHIYGKTFVDVAYAEGYVMAQDRMIQMDLGRRSAAGELGELIGGLEPGVLVSDIQMRAHHLRSTSQAAFDALEASSAPADVELVASLTSFANGVNAYIADLKAGKYTLPESYGVVYQAQGVAPWTEVDSLVLGRLLSFQLSFDGSSDALRSLIDGASQALASDPQRSGIAADLEQLAPVDPTFTLPGGWTQLLAENSSASRGKTRARKPGLPVSALREEYLATRDLGRRRQIDPDKGSNNFVIAPSKSTTKHAMVANDTHLALSNPATFYLVQLVATDASSPMNVMGVQFPGVPGVILGMNQHIAWGATVNNLDVTDTYSNKLVACSTGSGTCVVTKTGQVALVPRQETFNVGFGGIQQSSFTLTYYDVPNHGPITPRIDGGGTTTPTLEALGATEMSVRWTGDEPTQEIRALINLDRASTVQEGVAALDQDFKVGGQNWVLGDDQGHTGWTQTIRLPRRPLGAVPWKVMPGDGSGDWGVDLDSKYIPHAYDPAAGFLATANADPIGITANGNPLQNAPIVDGIPVYLGSDFDPGTRVGRITKRLTAQDTFALDDMQSVQADAISEWGQALAPTFTDAAQALVEEATTPGTHPELSAMVQAAPAAIKALLQPAHDKVTAWTFDTPSAVSSGEASVMDTPTDAQIADSQATALVAAFTATLAHRALDDELTVMGLTLDELDPLVARKVVARMCNHPELMTTGKEPNGDSYLFDDLTTAGVETKRTTAAQAVIDALAALTATTELGPDITTWRWGTVHTLTLDGLLPLPAFQIPLSTDPMFPHGFPRHGDVGTVDVGGNSLSSTDFTYTSGPAIRFVCELTPGGPVARNVLPGGEIFDPSSPHYRDQMELWRVNQTYDLAFQASEVVISAAREFAKNKDGRIHFQPTTK